MPEITAKFLKTVFKKDAISQWIDPCPPVPPKRRKTEQYLTFDVMYSNFYLDRSYFKFKEYNSAPHVRHKNILSVYSCEPIYFHWHREEVKKLLPIKPNLIKSAHKRLEKVLRMHNLDGKNSTLVSVHSRRRDYENHTKLLYRTNIPNQKYYEKAFELYRKK